MKVIGKFVTAALFTISCCAQSQAASPRDTHNPISREETLADASVTNRPINGDDPSASLNSYILEAVERIYVTRKRGGYDRFSAYSQDLDYGDEIVPAEPKRSGAEPPPRHRTMCVAAVAEVIIESINLYSEKTNDRSPYKSLPAFSWTSSTLQAIKPYLFMHDDVHSIYGYKSGDTPRGKPHDGKPTFALSRGTGHALTIFRIGEELPFSALRKGDFINFNRQNSSGHAAIFLNYIDASNKYTSKYTPGVIGFEYFSAQGRNRPDAGFEYRDAYFSPEPKKTAGGHVRDMAIRSSQLLFLNGGRLWTPSRWNVHGALQDIRVKVAASIPATVPPPKRDGEIQKIFEEEMPPSAIDFSGEEED